MPIFLEKSLNELILDKNNPRFAELYNGSDDEEELIEYLLYTESGDDIAKDIVEAKEFYPDRPLWVLKSGSKYLVKDGNRRCAAVKALQSPEKYNLKLPKFKLDKLPVLVYKKEEDLERRIRQEHTASLFRKWDRIAKALEVYKLFNSGKSIESMREIDSSPSDLVKLASFYYEAVKIGGNDLKKLLRRGRGSSGGKTIVFERLFKCRKLCGYNFRNKPLYQIEISDSERFKDYILTLIEFLKKYPETTHKTIDDHIDEVVKKMKILGFDLYINEKVGKNKKNNLKTVKKKNIKNNPNIERKNIPSPLNVLIGECYSLDRNNFANAKTALTRLSFECTLKYIVENTEYAKGKKLSESSYFKDAFYHKGSLRNFTEFNILKNKFIDLIKNVGDKKAFNSFDLDFIHQIIHNYKVGAGPADAKAKCDNLMSLLEFMLQDEKDLLSSLDLTKL